MKIDILQQAAKFREFWGEKAELRRFKDGTIAESTGKFALFCCCIVWLHL